MTKVKVVELGQLRRYLQEVPVDNLRLSQKLLILAVSYVFTLDLLPALNLIHRTDDATKLVFLELDLLE